MLQPETRNAPVPRVIDNIDMEIDKLTEQWKRDSISNPVEMLRSLIQGRNLEVSEYFMCTRLFTFVDISLIRDFNRDYIFLKKIAFYFKLMLQNQQNITYFELGGPLKFPKNKDTTQIMEK